MCCAGCVRAPGVMQVLLSLRCAHEHIHEGTCNSHQGCLSSSAVDGMELWKSEHSPTRQEWQCVSMRWRKAPADIEMRSPPGSTVISGLPWAAAAANLAVGETVILKTPPFFPYRNTSWRRRGLQRNGSLGGSGREPLGSIGCNAGWTRAAASGQQLRPKSRAQKPGMRTLCATGLSKVPRLTGDRAADSATGRGRVGAADRVAAAAATGLVPPMALALEYLGPAPRLVGFFICGLTIVDPGRRRDCHFADIPFPSLLEHLLEGEGGAAEMQNGSLADG